MQQSVHYLGHVVSAKGVETDPKKVSCVSKWPIATDVKELQQFLGLASYYRRFVKNFAHKARPLYWLTEKGRRWNCTHECGEAFVTLKHALISAPILAFPDFNHGFILDTDTSTDCLGAVLSQQSAEGEVITYTSRTLRGRKCWLWSGVYVNFTPTLYGQAFQARTDHNSLRWLHNFCEPKGQVAR